MNLFLIASMVFIPTAEELREGMLAIPIHIDGLEDNNSGRGNAHYTYQAVVWIYISWRRRVRREKRKIAELA